MVLKMLMVAMMVVMVTVVEGPGGGGGGCRVRGGNTHAPAPKHLKLF